MTSLISIPDYFLFVAGALQSIVIPTEKLLLSRVILCCAGYMGL